MNFIIQLFLLNYKNIPFSKSKTKLDSCRIYFIELEEEASSFLEVANCKKQVKVLNLQRP